MRRLHSSDLERHLQQRPGEPKCRAFTDVGLDPNHTALEFDDLFDDR